LGRGRAGLALSGSNSPRRSAIGTTWPTRRSNRGSGFGSVRRSSTHRPDAASAEFAGGHQAVGPTADDHYIHGCSPFSGHAG